MVQGRQQGGWVGSDQRGRSIYCLANFIHLGTLGNTELPGLSVLMRWVARLSSLVIEGMAPVLSSACGGSCSAPGIGRSSIIIVYLPLRKGEFWLSFESTHEK